MSAVQSLAHRWSRAQYDRAVEAGVFDTGPAVELLDGEVVDASPQSSRHARTVRWLRNHLARRLELGEWLVGGQEPVALGDFSEPEPDVWLARRAEVSPLAHPPASALALVVEVAHTSYATDSQTKLPLYAQASVPEVWLVDLGDDVVERHTGPRSGRYSRCEIYRPGQCLHVGGVPVEVADLIDPDTT